MPTLVVIFSTSVLLVLYIFTKQLALRAQANMADRKARSLTFKIPPGTNLGSIKEAIERESSDNEIKVFQEIGANEYLIELTSQIQAQDLIENGFDADSNHIRCHPPHGYYLNVSVMGLKAYICDDDVIEKLSQYGEIKGQVIRLKYKHDHDLAGLENGNRLIRMVLTSPSIPYSLNIGGEWCRIIHNNQLLLCSNCDGIGHSRKNCPTIECRYCKQLGHLSFHCPEKTARHTETNADEEQLNTENTQTETADEQATTSTMEEDTTPEPAQEIVQETTPADYSDNNAMADCGDNNAMDTSITAKRPHQRDSDSDPAPLQRRPRIKPSPNVNAVQHHRKKKDKNK